MLLASSTEDTWFNASPDAAVKPSEVIREIIAVVKQIEQSTY